MMVDQPEKRLLPLICTRMFGLVNTSQDAAISGEGVQFQCTVQLY